MSRINRTIDLALSGALVLVLLPIFMGCASKRLSPKEMIGKFEEEDHKSEWIAGEPDSQVLVDRNGQLLIGSVQCVGPSG
jgi:hypothetical protein